MYLLLSNSICKFLKEYISTKKTETMSIVLAVLEENIGVSIFGDKKMIVKNNSTGHIESVIIQKVFSLSDNICCGITGDAEWGIKLAEDIFLKCDELTVLELIEHIKSSKFTFREQSTFILAGKDENDDLFIFGYKTEGKPFFVKNEGACLIGTSPIELAEECIKLYSDYREKGANVNETCVNIIKYAASCRPEYISNDYDVFFVPCTKNT